MSSQVGTGQGSISNCGQDPGILEGSDLQTQQPGLGLSYSAGEHTHFPPFTQNYNFLLENHSHLLCIKANFNRVINFLVFKIQFANV